MRLPEPYRSSDTPDRPDTSGLTGPMSGPGPSRPASSRLASASMYTPSEPRPEKIGSYRITGELGRGGMGVVYLAVRTDDQFKTRVALKVIKRGMDSEEILRRFTIERQVLAALNHPNIARLIDADTAEDGRPYFVMEYIEGKPIDRHCDDERMSVKERLDLFRQVCAGVQHAHQNLIVHRDLKPSNILVTADGQVKIMDFGIAKVLNPQLAAVMADPTELGLRVMTTEYASPEQVRGDPISTSSDIYALGVVLYELLTGRRPYRFRTKLEEEIKRIVCESEPARPSTAVTQSDSFVTSMGETKVIDASELARSREGQPDRLKRRLSGDVDNIVLMAMRKEARRRYLSAEQFAEDIRRHLDGHPVIASPDRPLYRAGKFLRRNRYAMGALAAVVVSLAAGLGVAMYQRNEAQRQRAFADERNVQLASAIGYIDTGLNTVIGQYDTEVSKIEGGKKARDVLLGALQKHLESMPENMSNAPAAQSHRANILSRMGDLVGGLRSPTDNQPSKALPLYEEALRIRREQAAANPASADHAHKLAGALVRTADAMQKMNRLDEAAKFSQEARTILERFKDDPKAPSALRKMIADQRTQDGQILLDKGDAAGAMSRFEEAKKFYDVLAAENAKDENNRRNQGVILNKIGDALLAQNKPADALTKFRESLEVRRKLMEEESNDRTQRDYAVTQHYIAKALCRLGRKGEALAAAEDSVMVMERLVFANEQTGGRDGRAKRDLETFRNLQRDIEASEEGKPGCG
ncbi:MAG: serine/threonine protein kinase [Planctomycetes bacterium]|nr:serine/threonine protein kinase [Planctomycetota bacterium]